MMPTRRSSPARPRDQRIARLFAPALAALIACSVAATDDASVGETSSSTTHEASTSASASTSTSEITSTTTPHGPQGICPEGAAPLDGDSFWQCELDPPSGCCPAWKCNPGSTESHASWWDRYLCVPLEAFPGKPGDPCTIKDHAFSGLDTCEAGSMCWSWGFTGKGRCVAFCEPSEDEWGCADPSTYCRPTRVLAVCVPRCDPLVQGCPAAEACRYDGYGNSNYTCEPAGSTAYGEPCDGDWWSCGAGLDCAPAEHVPGCTSSACCTRYCDVDAPNTCPGAPAQSCVALFPEWSPYAKVGKCAVGLIEP